MLATFGMQNVRKPVTERAGFSRFRRLPAKIASSCRLQNANKAIANTRLRRFRRTNDTICQMPKITAPMFNQLHAIAGTLERAALNASPSQSTSTIKTKKHQNATR